MGLISYISGMIARRKVQKEQNLEVQRQLQKAVYKPKTYITEVKRKQPKLETPKIGNIFLSPEEIFDYYYYDVNPRAKKVIIERIKQDQEILYSRLTDYDLRAMQYQRKTRTSRMSKLEEAMIEKRKALVQRQLLRYGLAA